MPIDLAAAGRTRDFLDDALQIHQQWKRTLQAAVHARDTLDADTLGRDDCCALGHWLYAEGRRRYRSGPEFARLVAKHQEFHQLVRILAIAINGGDYEDAERMFGGHSQYTYASIELGVAIMKLKMAVAV